MTEEAGNKQVGEIAQAKEAWAKARKISQIEPVTSQDDVEHKVLYTPDDLKDFEYMRDLGLPGEYPFTRGVYPGMYRKAKWGLRQYSGFGTPEDTNKRWKFLIESGQFATNLAFDLPTHMGLDSDDPLVEDEVGRVGVSIDSLRDIEILWDGLPMNMIPASYNTVGPAPVILAMLIANAENQGLSAGDVIGVFTNDILAVFVARGNWIFPPKPSMRLVTDMIEYCCRNMPRFYPVNIQGVFFRGYGASKAQEMGYTFADAVEYIDWTLERGLSIDDIAPRLSFFIGCAMEIFEEAAKFRAARRIWARMMKEKYGAKEKNSMRFRTTSATGGELFTAEEPLNNLMRGTLGLLGAVLGGVQATFVAGYDEAYAIPTEEAALLGLRTMQIMQEETDLCRTIDPLAGSYYVESLTNEMENKILGYYDDIQRVGGALAAVESGYTKRELDKRALDIQRKRDNEELPIVGVYIHKREDVEKPRIQLHKPNPEALRLQIERLKQIKSERNYSNVTSALAKVKKAAQGDENLIPSLVEAAKTYATLGEIMGVLKEVFGEHQESRNIF
ncbi:MAG: methylmalonyl-CoA mutase [Candidatus Hydrogenedentota bacterium]|nr:MAG: methylmalonyl-CoA mutase [Candidatus Hydrogenedentota bacterium]